MSGVLLLVVGIIVAAIFQSSLLVLSGICLAVANNIWAWRRAEMFPIYLEQTKAAAKESWIIAAIAAVWVFFG